MSHVRARGMMRQSPLLVHRHARGYIAPMRRATILALVGILVVAFGAYSAFWWVAAGRIKQEAEKWAAQAAPQHHVTVLWQTMRVAGYPFSFRIELHNALIRSDAAGAAGILHASVLSASVTPWNFHVATFDAPDGFDAILGPVDAPVARMNAAEASGAVAMPGDGGVTIWLNFNQPKIDAISAFSARFCSAWVIVPAHPAVSHADPGIAAAALLHDLVLPAAPPGFSKAVDEFGFGVTMMGALPSGSPREAAAAWRDSGGTLELDNFYLRWGAIGGTASGTLALDGDLQPVGSFSGAISGYEQLLNALVAAGRVKASDARVARLALSMLGRVGPDGRTQISTTFAIQDGEMQLGPAKLGKAPHIDW
jgi:hypothetical protein